MIRYFVSYAHGDAYAAGFGWMDVPRDAPIRNGRDVKAVAKHIAEVAGGSKITVLNWRRFEDEPS
jgi:hypothetical protein